MEKKMITLNEVIKNTCKALQEEDRNGLYMDLLDEMNGNHMTVKEVYGELARTLKTLVTEYNDSYYTGLYERLVQAKDFPIVQSEGMALLEELKKVNGRQYVCMLDDELKGKVIEYVRNNGQELFEDEDIVNEEVDNVLNSSVYIAMDLIEGVEVG